MKTNKPFLAMDERNKQIASRIIAVMYFLTIISITGIVIYRQIALGQSIHDFEDIAIILTVNSLFLVSALLYFGAVTIQRFKIKTIIFGYLTMVVLGFLFTYAKYNIFQSPGLSLEQLVDKVIIISLIIGLITGFFILFSVLGIKKLDKELK